MRHDHFHAKAVRAKAHLVKAHRALHLALLPAIAGALALAGGACNAERLLIIKVTNEHIATAMIETLLVSTNLHSTAESIPVTSDGGMVPFPVEIGIYIPRGVSTLMVTVSAMNGGQEVARGTRLIDVSFVGLEVVLCPRGAGSTEWECPVTAPSADAGCSTGDDGGTIADGGAVVTADPPSQYCIDYCQSLTSECPDLYGSPDVCKTVCALASVDGTVVDLGCQLRLLNSADASHDEKCSGAGIISPVCGPCVAFCNVWTAACGDPSQTDDCFAACQDFTTTLACYSGWLTRATMNRTYCRWTLPGLQCGAACL